jgi:hypothetical protein
MIKLVTFCLPNCSLSANRCRESALRFGAEQVRIYTEGDIDPFFQKVMAEEIKETVKRGWFYCWKPYIVLDAILNAKEGDILVYCDAGQEVVGDLSHIANAMDEDIMMFTNGFQHSHWCKRETARNININYGGSFGDTNSPYFGIKQVQASLIFFKVNDITRSFVREWYAWTIMPGMIDDTSRGEQFPEFAQHRYDQAILTCLQIKYGYKLHWFPSTTNFHQQTSEQYGVTVLHHRMRNNDY